MTGHFVLTPRARGDLEKIWDYTVERWGRHTTDGLDVARVLHERLDYERHIP